MNRTRRAYLGLGANVGDAAGTLAEAVGVVGRIPGVRLRAVSRLFATRPIGVVDQPEFRNAVIAADVTADVDPQTAALALLRELKAIEADFGRRPGPRWGPRQLDLDVLVFGRARLAVERTDGARSIDAGHDPARALRLLVVPHPEAQQRLFVLAPLADLAPRLVPPGWGESVTSARDRQARLEGPGAVRAIAGWNPGANTWTDLAEE